MKLRYREAIEKDLPCLVEMLADDELGAQREDPSYPVNSGYVAALVRIIVEPNNELIVVEADQRIVAMLQLTFIPYLTHIGSIRCLIEGVRTHKSVRGQGLGAQILDWAIHRAKEKNCSIIQITSDKKRPDAIRFYENLGFEASHQGLKMKLD